MSARLALAGVAKTGDVFRPITHLRWMSTKGFRWKLGEYLRGVGHPNFFRGPHTDGANLADPADDTNVNFDITVAKQFRYLC